jgi:hypothetical protein
VALGVINLADLSNPSWVAAPNAKSEGAKPETSDDGFKS